MEGVQILEELIERKLQKEIEKPKENKKFAIIIDKEVDKEEYIALKDID
jgi:hypothetical protein